MRTGRRRSNADAGHVSSSAAPKSRDLYDTLSWVLVATTTAVLPLVVSPGAKNAFRLPKQLALEAVAMALAAVAICRFLVGDRAAGKRCFSPPLLAVIGATVAWATIVTVLSTNFTLSIYSLLAMGSGAVFFVAAYATTHHRPLETIYFAFFPAVVNALIAVSQYMRIIQWPSLEPGVPRRISAIGLLGNADDIGMFLVSPIVAAAALAVTSQRHRKTAVAVGVVASGGLFACESLTAIGAVFVGLFLLGIAARPRLTISAAAATLIAAAMFVQLSPRHRAAAETNLKAAISGNWDALLSGRVPAFQAAAKMFVRHPVFGVGLGCFPFHYFDYRSEVQNATAPVRRDDAMWAVVNKPEINFGEVHSEHLQTLAEGGLPLYMTFLAGLVVLARPSFRGRQDVLDERERFARRAALPLASSFAVLALAAFPLRLAAPTANALFISAIVLGWSERESV